MTEQTKPQTANKPNDLEYVQDNLEKWIDGRFREFLNDNPEFNDSKIAGIVLFRNHLIARIKNKGRKAAEAK